jgi:hypothetical protein
MTPDFVAFVEGRLKASIEAAYPGIPIMFSNVPVANTVDTFIAVHVMASDTALPISLGLSAYSRNVGVIQIDVFTPKDKGSGSASRIALFCGKILHRVRGVVSDEGVATFKDYAIQDRGEVRGRHKHMVSIPYSYDFIA